MLTSVSSSSLNHSKLFQSILVSSCLILIVCFFTPFEIFINNIVDLGYVFSEISLYLLFICVFLTTCFTLILIAIPQRIYGTVVSLLLLITILLWLQGNIFYKDYGALDGGEINWSNWAIWGYVEIGIWIISIILTIIFAQKIKKIANAICIIILITLFSVFTIQYLGSSPSESKELVFDESSKFDFSSDKNVIIILVDTLQSDIFYEIISDNPDLKEQFDGFIYYPDSTSGFPQTEASVPNLLTGSFYDNSIPFSEYIEKAYQEYSVPKVLKERGFQVDLIPTYYDFTIYKSKDIASNLIRKEHFKSIKEGLNKALHLIDVALFRNVPQITKKYIINENRWLLSNCLRSDQFSHLDPGAGDKNFYRDISMINETVTAPTFKFFHLKGCHGPYNKNELGEHVDHVNSREAYTNFCTFNLKRLVSFLDELKSRGIYDKSLIYIVSDHGEGRFEEEKINTKLIDKNTNPNQTMVPIKIKARAIPLMMTKDFFSTGTLKTSNKQLSLAGIPRMIFKDLNLNLNNLEKNHSEKENNLPAIRRYLFYNWPDKYPSYEYNIAGHSWFDSSWSGPNKVYTKTGTYDKDFSVIFEEYSSNKYILDGSGQANDYEFKFKETNSGGYCNIKINNEETASKYFLSIVPKNIVLNDTNIEIRMGHKKLNKVEIRNNSHIDKTPIIGVQLPENDLKYNNRTLSILYNGSNGRKIDNPIEAIHIFKLSNK